MCCAVCTVFMEKFTGFNGDEIISKTFYVFKLLFTSYLIGSIWKLNFPILCDVQSSLNPSNKWSGMIVWSLTLAI